MKIIEYGKLALDIRDYKRIVAGIDPGWKTGIGLICQQSSGVLEAKAFYCEAPNEVQNRYRDFVHGIETILKGALPELAVIEGYSFGSKFAREAMGESGGLLRYVCEDLDLAWTTVAPIALQKFVHGEEGLKAIKMQIKLKRRRFGKEASIKEALRFLPELEAVPLAKAEHLADSIHMARWGLNLLLEYSK